jgi:hypothetical protein
MMRFNANAKNKTKGQSFIELALVFMILMLLFAGVVELGNLINVYLDIIDSGREAARNANTYDLYHIESDGSKTIGNLVYNEAAKIAWNTLNTSCQGRLKDKDVQALPDPCPAMRIPFDPATDDIVISVISYDGSSILRFPTGGWSRFGNHTSAVSNADIASHLDPSAPVTGMIIVEIFYDYHQMLGMPFFTEVIPDPIPVHTFSIMPYPLAEPTPTPLP